MLGWSLLLWRCQRSDQCTLGNHGHKQDFCQFNGVAPYLWWLYGLDNFNFNLGVWALNCAYWIARNFEMKKRTFAEMVVENRLYKQIHLMHAWIHNQVKWTFKVFNSMHCLRSTFPVCSVASVPAAHVPVSHWPLRSAAWDWRQSMVKRDSLIIIPLDPALTSTPPLHRCRCTLETVTGSTGHLFVWHIEEYLTSNIQLILVL